MQLILNLLIYGVSSIKTISVFENVKQPFKINRIPYRESLNPIFALESSNVQDSSENPSMIYQGNIIYGSKQLKDLIIQNKWKKIDEVPLFNDKDEIYTILASTKLEKDNILEYKIMDNSYTIFNTKTARLKYLNRHLINYGLHNISIWAKANNPICLCCSKNKGFTNSYQLAVWKDYNSKEIEVYNKSYVDQLHNVELITNTTNSNDYNDFDDLSDMSYNEILEHLETKSYILSKSLVS